MQNRSIKITFLLVILFATAVNAAVIDPLRIGGGARSLAMGRTGNAAYGKYDALFANPANVAGIDGFTLTSMQAKIAEEVNYTLINIGTPSRFGKLAIGYLGSGVSGINQTTKDSSGRVVSTGTFDYTNSVIALALANNPTDKLALGGQLKIYNRAFGTITNGSATGMGLDIGAIVRPRENLSLGVSLQNISPSNISQLTWANGTKEELPTTLKTGISFMPREQLLVAFDINTLSDSPPEYKGGLEWSLNPLLALRAGLESSNLTFGVGLKRGAIAFDYAYFMDSTLSQNSTHYISFSFAPETSKALIVIRTEPTLVPEITPEDRALLLRIEKYVALLEGKREKAKTPTKKAQVEGLIKLEIAKMQNVHKKYGTIAPSMLASKKKLSPDKLARIEKIKEYIDLLQEKYLSTKSIQKKKYFFNLIRQQHQKIKNIVK